jgi:hypothetical protein
MNMPSLDNKTVLIIGRDSGISGANGLVFHPAAIPVSA